MCGNEFREGKVKPCVIFPAAMQETETTQRKYPKMNTTDVDFTLFFLSLLGLNLGHLANADYGDCDDFQPFFS